MGKSRVNTLWQGELKYKVTATVSRIFLRLIRNTLATTSRLRCPSLERHHASVTDKGTWLTAKVSIRIQCPMRDWTAGDTLVQTASSHMVASMYMQQVHRVMHPRRQVHGGKHMAANISCGSKYMAANISCGSKYMAASIWRQIYHVAASTWRQIYHVAASSWRQAYGSKITGP